MDQVAQYKITFRGQQYTPNIYKGANNLLSLEIDLGVGPSADRARLIFGGCGSLQAALEDPITIELGDQDQSLPVLRGHITYLDFQGTHVIIEAQKPERRLATLRFHQLFEKQTSGAIVRQILQQARLDAGRIEDGIAFPYYPLSRHSDGYQAIDALARLNDFIAYMDRDNKLVFARPKKSRPRRTFSYAKEVLALDFAQQRPAYGKFIVYGAGAASKKKAAGQWLHTAAADYQGQAGQGQALVTENYALRSRPTANKVAAGHSQRSRRQAIVGKIKTLGAAELTPGECFAVRDSPQATLNRTFLVTAVKHLFNRSDGFVTLTNFCQIE